MIMEMNTDAAMGTDCQSLVWKLMWASQQMFSCKAKALHPLQHYT